MCGTCEIRPWSAASPQYLKHLPDCLNSIFPANEKGKQNRFMCDYQGCKKRFCFDGITRSCHREKCPCKANGEIHYSSNTAQGEMNVDHAVSSDPAENYKFNYSCKLLGDGLLELTRRF